MTDVYLRYVVVSDGDVLAFLRKQNTSKHLIAWAEDLDILDGTQNPLHVVLARDHGRVVGIFSARVADMPDPPLYTMGTYVERQYRRRGIATRMWTLMIKKLHPRRIECGVASREGRAFARRQKASRKETLEVYAVRTIS